MRQQHPPSAQRVFTVTALPELSGRQGQLSQPPGLSCGCGDAGHAVLQKGARRWFVPCRLLSAPALAPGPVTAGTRPPLPGVGRVARQKQTQLRKPPGARGKAVSSLGLNHGKQNSVVVWRRKYERD
ncbi:hypothetical protein AV530_003574 [Patagioenas fasciata monilis]|uniref:Uncharacterized protein n=1 Tax=Patagioenas fasciata monilis TaxID=372326 RepID=A0A1V4KY47_PATFA|nr:hypothetical protein AV530_003574 [Patagioenas fasciata monilis]